MKATIPFLLITPFLLTSCARHLESDTALRAKIAGTWTTADVSLPDQARVSQITTTFQPDGSWANQYRVTRTGESRKQVTRGGWRIENGFLFELQTNIDGRPDALEREGRSRIIRLDRHGMILSNWYAPQRVFFRKP